MDIFVNPGLNPGKFQSISSGILGATSSPPCPTALLDEMIGNKIYVNSWLILGSF